MDMTVGVVGSGKFGLTITKLISKNANVLLYSRNVDKVESLNTTGEVLGVSLPDTVRATNDIREICETCKLLVPIIPTVSVRSMIEQFAPYLTPSHFIIHASKGLEIDPMLPISATNLNTLSEVIQQSCNVRRIGCISGPNLSKEILDGLPTATVVASQFDEVIDIGKKILKSENFFVFGSHNIRGIELAGALKNIYALGSGVIHGKGFGRNAQSVLLTRGIKEMMYIGDILGVESDAFLSSAGIGDLIATGTSELSRNYTLGAYLANGKTLQQALEETNDLAEGVHTLKMVNRFASNMDIQLPICDMIYDIIYNNASLESSLSKLMN